MPTVRSAALAAGFTALCLLTVAAGVTAQGGPEDVQQQLLSALSRGDVTAALALFTDDAVIDSQSGLCTDAPCVGKAAIRKDLERLAADKSRRVTPLSTYVAGNVLVTRFEARSATIQGVGVERVILWGIQGDARREDRRAQMLPARAHRRADRPLHRMGGGAPLDRSIERPSSRDERYGELRRAFRGTTLREHLREF